MPVKAASPSVTARPVANPYGLNGTPGVASAPRAPMTGENQIIFDATVPARVSNRAAWLSLFFGVAALGLTVLNTLPGSQTIWVSGAGVVAVLWGVRALARRRAGSATITWAPIIGMLLGLAATASMLTGVGVMSLVGSNGPQTVDSASTPAPALVQTTSPVPTVFPNNSQLSADEAAVQSLATGLNRTYAHGNASLSGTQAWPASLSMKGNTVIAPNGHAIAKLPAGLVANYQLSADHASYRIAVTVPGSSELATYSSSANGFSWSCLASDTTCVPAN